jgi:hypothetical protein
MNDGGIVGEGIEGMDWGWELGGFFGFLGFWVFWGRLYVYYGLMSMLLVLFQW